MIKFAREINALVDNKNTQAHEYRQFFSQHKNELSKLNNNSFLLPETVNLFLYNTLRAIGYGMVQTESLHNYYNGFGGITYSNHLISTEYTKGNLQETLYFEISDLHCPLLVGFNDTEGDEPEFNISSTDTYSWDATQGRIVVVLNSFKEETHKVNNYPFVTEPKRNA